MWRFPIRARTYPPPGTTLSAYQKSETSHPVLELQGGWSKRETGGRWVEVGFRFGLGLRSPT